MPCMASRIFICATPTGSTKRYYTLDRWNVRQRAGVCQNPPMSITKRHICRFRAPCIAAQHTSRPPACSARRKRIVSATRKPLQPAWGIHIHDELTRPRLRQGEGVASVASLDSTKRRGDSCARRQQHTADPFKGACSCVCCATWVMAFWAAAAENAAIVLPRSWVCMHQG